MVSETSALFVGHALAARSAGARASRLLTSSVCPCVAGASQLSLRRASRLVRPAQQHVRCASILKKRLVELMPGKQEALTKMKKEHGAK